MGAPWWSLHGGATNVDYTAAHIKHKEYVSRVHPTRDPKKEEKKAKIDSPLKASIPMY